MKLFVLFTSLTVFQFLPIADSKGQIKKLEEAPKQSIGKVGSAGATWIEMIKIGDSYSVIYQDVTYQQLTEFKSFTFKDIDNAFEEFYKIISEGFNNPPKEDIKLDLPEDIIYLHFTSQLGIVSVQFIHVQKKTNITGYSVYLTKRRLNKLFGKEN